MNRIILWSLAILATSRIITMFSNIAKRKEEEYLFHLERFENDTNYAMNHLMDDIQLQEEYVKHEIKNRERYILAQMETQFSGRKYRL